MRLLWYYINMILTLRKPSAWIPIVLSVAILGMMSLYIIGILPPEPTNDEGAMAHLFQIWAVLEFFAIIFFAFKWLAREPQEAWKVIAFQIGLAIIPFAIVFFNHW